MNIKLLQFLLFCAAVVAAANGQPSNQPILRIETGTHAAMVNRIAVDAESRYLVSASLDKTARVWDVANGNLLRVLRPPIGDGVEGSLYTVAISPDATTVAVGGWTGHDWDGTNSIYLFDRESGVMRQRVTNLPNVITFLSFSPDGRFLSAAMASAVGVRLYRTADFAESGRDADYGDDVMAMDFHPNGKRLVTTSRDGFIRLYAIADDGVLRLMTKRRTRGGKIPAAVKFSPDGERVAVGFLEINSVDVYSGADDLDFLYAPNTKPYEFSRFPVVAWSADNQKLIAAGIHPAISLASPIVGIRVWDGGGRKAYRDFAAATSVVTHALALPGDKIVYGIDDGSWGVIDDYGVRKIFIEPTIANNTGNFQKFLLAPDAAAIQFSYEPFAKSLAQFDIAGRRLTATPPDAEKTLRPPRAESKRIKLSDLRTKEKFKLNGREIELEKNEYAIHAAVAPDEESFVLGSTFFLRRYSRDGRELWRSQATVALSVNVSADGRFAVSARNDGTIRWHRMSDGAELLAFLPHADRRRWVLWTPSGYYDASAADGEDLVGWHVNGGAATAADFFPFHLFKPHFYRPDVIDAVLQTADETQAIAVANKKSGRPNAPLTIKQALPPVVEINSPQTKEITDTTTTISYKIRTPSGEPVTGVKVLVDGKEINLSETDRAKIAKGAADLTLQLPKKDSELIVIAENRFTRSLPAKILFKWRGK